MKKAEDLKKLNTELRLLKEHSTKLKDSMREHQQNYNKYVKLVKEKEAEINSFNKSKDIVISEHSVLRFLDRVLEVDLEEIEKKMLTPFVKQAIELAGGTTNVVTPEGWKFIVKDYVIITVTI